MSGHSKWAQIKRQKGAADQKKGRLFSKLSREIAIAAKTGRDPGINFKLRLVLDRAKEASMTKDAIDRAIKRATSEDKSAAIEDVVYEGYGPGGTAFLVQAGTSNRNRTTQNLRHKFSQYGGNLGNPGSVAFLFSARGQILVPKEGNENLEEISLQAIDLGAEDVKTSDEGLEIYTVPLDVGKVKDSLEKHRVKIASCEVLWRAQTMIEPDEQTKQQILQLIESLEEDEDVISVHTNANL